MGRKAFEYRVVEQLPNPETVRSSMTADYAKLVFE